MISIQPLEALYLVINLTAFVLTFSALVDARADSAAVKLLNGKARELAATGNVRREALRLVVLGLLLSIAGPGLLSDQEVRLSPFVVDLMAIPIVLLVSTILDARDRRAMTAVVAADLLAAGASALERIEQKIDRNTTISQEASDHADRAYHEANSVNEKISRNTEAIRQQGEDAAEDREGLGSTIDDTHDKVVDLHAAIEDPTR